MDATQFQAAVVAWGAAATTLIAVLLGIALAVRAAINQLITAHTANATAIAAVASTVQQHEKAINGELTARVVQIADDRISTHRRATDSAV